MDTDILCVHRNTCIRICVVGVGVGIHMYTYIYEKTPCVHTNLHMFVYILACVHADFTCGCVEYKCMHECVEYLHIGTPLYVYIFTCMVDKFIGVRVYHYTYAHRV